MRKRDMWIAACTAAAAVGAGLLLRSNYEREQLSVETVEIRSDQAADDCRMVFLSDLHDHEFGENNGRLLQAVDKVKPDVILIGGDMMVSHESVDLRVSLALLRQLAKRCPVYYGNGNHETRMDRERKNFGNQYDWYMKKLKEIGVITLSNKTEYFRSDIAITGIDLAERYYKKFHPDHLSAEKIEAMAGPAERERFQILLCHSPLFFDSCRAWGADLTLSGHFHGGTIRLPILGGVMTPQFQFFLPVCAGTFEEDGKYMIVSRGLGTHSINIRLNNKPQLAVIDLKKKEFAPNIYRSRRI